MIADKHDTYRLFWVWDEQKLILNVSSLENPTLDEILYLLLLLLLIHLRPMRISICIVYTSVYTTNEPYQCYESKANVKRIKIYTKRLSITYTNNFIFIQNYHRTVELCEFRIYAQWFLFGDPSYTFEIGFWVSSTVLLVRINRGTNVIGLLFIRLDFYLRSTKHLVWMSPSVCFENLI